MAVANRLLQIMNSLKERLEQASPPGFNYRWQGRVDKGFVQLQNCMDFPHLYLAGIEVVESEAADQATFSVPIAIEIYGYVKDEEPMDAVLKLVADVEKVVYSEPELGGLVWGLKMNVEVGVADQYGVALITLRAVTEFTVQEG